MKSRISLDHAATTPVNAAARAAMMAALDLGGNPSSVHAGGRAAHALLEGARDAVARFAGVAAEQIVFTSGGTEALALAANGARLAGPARPRFLVGATEHSAVLQARDDAVVMPVDSSGLIDLAALVAVLADGPALVAVQAANNETGVIQPLAEVATLVRDTGGLLLVDAVQAAGKMTLPDADFVALSAHKLGGPPGVGALIVKDPASLIPVQRGGGQERGHRGGTPNLPGIAGFAAAVAEPHDWNAVAARRMALETWLKAAGAIIHGEAAPRLPNISSIGLPGVAASTQVMMLDLEGFMVSAGAACSSGKVKSSHVLAAMGLGAAAGEAIRVSLSPATTDTELDAFASAWLAMAARLGRKGAA
ncbi:cysteine desulfurase family protein [Sandarakinorhabdus sp. AAP62]|uniref:cysteine desulfurase family protein n=1 Tax=Sandarakinorhabdus sp. AAP62 TaxID=1248916 RepID=UPI0003607927|nr:cysteine desulfurase family protein [Sandarakinorhabdus sp. AAP62]